MANLKNIKAKAIALVDQGANNKEFFLLKRDKEKTVDKDKVIELLKEGKMSEKQIELLIKDMSDDDKNEIKEIIKSQDSVSVMKAEDFKKVIEESLTDELLEKAGAKFSKTVLADIKKLSGLATDMKKVLDKLSEGTEKKEKDGDEKPAKDKAELKKRMDKDSEYETMSEDEDNWMTELITEKSMDKEGK